MLAIACKKALRLPASKVAHCCHPIGARDEVAPPLPALGHRAALYPYPPDHPLHRRSRVDLYAPPALFYSALSFIQRSIFDACTAPYGPPARVYFCYFQISLWLYTSFAAPPRLLFLRV